MAKKQTSTRKTTRKKATSKKRQTRSSSARQQAQDASIASLGGPPPTDCSQSLWGRTTAKDMTHLEIVYKGNIYNFHAHQWSTNCTDCGCVWMECKGRGYLWLQVDKDAKGNVVRSGWVLHFCDKQIDTEPVIGRRAAKSPEGEYIMRRKSGPSAIANVRKHIPPRARIQTVDVAWNGYTRAFDDYGGNLYLEQYGRGEIYKIDDVWYMSLYNWPGAHEDEKTGGTVKGTYDYGAVVS